MDDFYEEIQHYLAGGTYHSLTISSKNPESRKATIRKASKNYTIKNERLYYNHNGNLRLVVFQAQVCETLKSCHDDLGSGGHPGRRRTLEKVLASYHWKTVREDVKKWVEECPRCQRHETVKTVAPVLHPIQVQEAWSVLGIDLIGPLPTTAKGKRFILTATDLFTKWVVAKSLYTKTATEVSRKIVNILHDFGLVERIITDQGREFVNEVNRGVFEALGVKHCITSAYHPQANGQDERTNRNIKTALAKYCGEDKNDWDIHLRGIVAGINTSKQRSTKFTPYCALFGRHPRTAGVINATKEEGDDDKGVVVQEETEEHLEAKIADVVDLHAKIYQNITLAQERQKREYETRKKRNVKSFVFKVGDEVLKANKRKEGRKGGRLEENWSGPYMIASISGKGVTTLSKKGTQLKQNVNVSQLKPFISPKLREPKGPDILNPQEDSFKQLVHDHDYWPGLGYLQELDPVQMMLLNYVLDENRYGAEILAKDGDVCLTREDFWTLGLSQCMESNIGNACFKIIKEAAHRHGKEVHIVDLYVVPTWKTETGDPMAALPVSDLAQHIAPGQWTIKFGRDIKGFPHQTSGNSCGIFILMYALCMSTDLPFLFTEKEMTQIRKWWCVSLMERFKTEGHGQRFAHWTNEAKALLQWSLQPIYRLPKGRCHILQLPGSVLSEVLKEVVLLEGDGAYLTLALVCTAFRDIVSTTSFRRQAHFQWLDSVATWSRFSASYKQDFYVMYSIGTCCGCGKLYKDNTPGYVGTGKRGVLQGIYSEDPYPGYCSHFCSQVQ
ncbi:hypothetical protein OJAV_G00070140 [Oryzias javanicus]|uniref:Gypsy retrotransposon integrase-like protein 1 n=1 Tax=Oryzias javanicus TaxID=123683 RepID=A0A3S2PVS7_ORYJA|nr:hypothetical protein OJAV_G00070140 [Oryzias javanicus]